MIVWPCCTKLPLAGLALLLTVAVEGTTGCSVLQLWHTGAGSIPAGLVGTTALRSVPVASASTVAVYTIA